MLQLQKQPKERMTAYLFGVNVRVLGEATKSKDSNSHCGGFYEFYMRLSDHLHRERRSFDGSAGQQHDLIVYPFLFFYRGQSLSFASVADVRGSRMHAFFATRSHGRLAHA